MSYISLLYHLNLPSSLWWRKEPYRETKESLLTKSQRTVFVSQLTQKVEEYDLRKFFKKKAGRIVAVHFLWDKRSNRHKGCAYIEFEDLDDVPYAVRQNDKVPTFQRFPILVQPSESEANLVSIQGEDVGKYRVYVGHIDKKVLERDIKSIFSECGGLSHCQLSKESVSNTSNFCFVNFHKPQDAQLAIDGLNGMSLGSSVIKVSWAKTCEELGTAAAIASGRPADGNERIRRARSKAGDATGEFMLPEVRGVQGYAGIDPSAYVGVGTGDDGSGGMSTTTTGGNTAMQAIEEAKRRALGGGGGDIGEKYDSLDKQESGATVGKGTDGAEARAALMAKLAARAGLSIKTGGGEERGEREVEVKVTSNLMISNCFRPSEETEEGWWEDIELDMREECSKFGAVLTVAVDRNDERGQVKVCFGDVTAAKKAREVFEGRWFGERQLGVEYV
ncbi:hypothetical protein TrCOL_g13665 [Triparma columacea]|uniref:RRM domain-containing protein n=1 Tax=Triparma columacea TaxID=722753 RepID=A0A9W7L4M7_9STRA|nr:hypothetical protein TrCOL_g13665 [Triparma columacea]